MEEIEVEDYDSFSRVISIFEDVWVEKGNASVKFNESTIKLEFNSVEPAVVAQLVRDSSEYLGALRVQPLEFYAHLKLREPVRIGTREVAQLEDLKETRYKVRKG